MTLRQIANITGAAYSTVAAYAQKAGWTKNGKQTLLDDNQTTIIVEAMKQPVSSGTKSNLLSQIEGVETVLTPALKLEMLYRQIDEIKTAELARVKHEKEALQIRLSEAKQWYSVKRVLIETGREYSWKPLKEYSRRHGFGVEKAFDKNYGEVNAYHRDVWNAVYGLEL
jgi:hypothetical protein